MIKKIILRIRLLFAKTYVGIDVGYKDDYSVKCLIKKVGDKLYIIKTKCYKNYELNKQQGQYNELETRNNINDTCNKTLEQRTNRKER